jgi:DNA-directed RNA polymerase subunit RPC12/RpoP
MFCTQCGVELSSTANFCRRCGAKVRKGNKPVFRSSINTSQMLLKAKEKIKNFSEPKIENYRDFLVTKLDSISNNVKDPEKLTSLSTTQRDYLAQRLAGIRTRIAKKQETEGNTNFEPTVEEAQEILELNEELLKQLETEKCLICYKSLKLEDQTDELIVCPQCGHGGHKNHIYSWFERNNSCPYCKANITTDQVLTLHF